MPDATVLPLTDPARLAAAAYLSRYRGPTRKQYDADLRFFFDWCRRHQLPPLEAKRPHIELYVRYMEEDRGLAPGTVCRHLSTIVGYYRYASIDGVIVRSPAEYVRRPKVSDESSRLGLDRHELGALIARARAGTPDEAALISLLGLLGLRVTEACDVDIEDFGAERGHRTLTVTGKGGKVATIPLPVPVGRVLDQAIGDRTEGPLIRTTTGARMDRYAATRIVKRLAKAAGIGKRISPHSLRHSFVTAALDAGVPLRDVQIAARHSDPRTTNRYDRARHNLDRHANYIVASFIAGAA